MGCVDGAQGVDSPNRSVDGVEVDMGTDIDVDNKTMVVGVVAASCDDVHRRQYPQQRYS